MYALQCSITGPYPCLQLSATDVEAADAALDRLKAEAVNSACAAVAGGEAMAQAIERFADAGGDPRGVQEAVAQAVGHGTGISDFLSAEAEFVASCLHNSCRRGSRPR